MDHQPDLGDIAKAVIDANLYMILGTAGDDGHPWVIPVYYSAEGYTDFTGSPRRSRCTPATSPHGRR